MALSPVLRWRGGIPPLHAYGAALGQRLSRLNEALSAHSPWFGPRTRLVSLALVMAAVIAVGATALAAFAFSTEPSQKPHLQRVDEKPVLRTFDLQSLPTLKADQPPEGDSLKPTPDLMPRQQPSFVAQEDWPATLVTAYFALSKSKFSHDFYVDRTRDFFSIRAPMVVFTNVAAQLRDIRRKSLNEAWSRYPSVFIHLELNDTETYQRYYDAIARLYDLDMQSARHSPELYVVWHAKIEFADRAARMNPFATRKFIWLDIGSVRSHSSAVVGSVWPKRERVESRLGANGKLTMMSIEGYDTPPCNGGVWVDAANGVARDASRFPLLSDPLLVPEQFGECEPVGCFLVGGLWGGDATAIAAVRRAYIYALDRYVAATRPKYNFADQHTYLTLWCSRPELIEVVRGVGRGNWFYLFDYLA